MWRKREGKERKEEEKKRGEEEICGRLRKQFEKTAGLLKKNTNP